jgi:hypothetical protein
MSSHFIPIYSNVKTYVARPLPSGVEAPDLEQFIADLIRSH